MTADHDACQELARAWDREPVCGCGHTWGEHMCHGGCLVVVEDRDDEHWHPVFCACPAAPPREQEGR